MGSPGGLPLGEDCYFWLVSLMLSDSKLLYVVARVLVALWAWNGVVASSQQTPRPQNFNAASTRGEKTFASSCAGCHGLDGRGGERAPNIADSSRVQRLSDAQIAHVVENGIPGTGMPAFHSLASSDVKAVVTYLRTLHGTKKALNLPGDGKRGETIFFAKAGCSGCHMVLGKGGFIASDLSGYGRAHAVEQTRSAIINPPPGSDQQARMVTATTRAGEKYVGRIRNEDNFSLQLQTWDGAFRFLSKSDIEKSEYSSQGLMPTDYASTLSSDELNDLVNYLLSVANARTGPPGTPQREFEDQ